jgi:hypothetical protein
MTSDQPSKSKITINSKEEYKKRDLPLDCGALPGTLRLFFEEFSASAV